MELGVVLQRPCSFGRRTVDLKHRLGRLAASVSVHDTFVPNDQAGVDRLHAFRLLVHAEVEAFIEAVASTVIDVTEAKATSQGTLTHAGHHLLVTWSVVRSTRRDAGQARYPSYQSAQAKADLSARPDDLKSAISQHRSRIAANHGVTAANVRRLLLPLGFRESCFAPGLLDQLDDLGEARGAVAHSSGVIGVQNWPSGSSEFAMIRRVLPGLELLERYAPRLLIPS